MEMALSFNDIQFDVIPQNSQPRVRGYQIGTALGYFEGKSFKEIEAEPGSSHAWEDTTRLDKRFQKLIEELTDHPFFI